MRVHGHTAADGWTWDNTWSLMVMNVDGSQEVAVTSGPIIDQVPDSISWSPDGTRIAYAAGGRIFVVGLDGAGPTSIAEGSHAAWSRDGDTIAYLVDCDVRATTPDGLHDRSIVDLATVGSDAATCDGAVDLAWSPDGKGTRGDGRPQHARPDRSRRPGRVRHRSRWDPHSIPLGLESELQHCRPCVAADPVKRPRSWA